MPIKDKENNNMLPCMPYTQLCLEGAKSISTEFYNMFLDTSTTASGITSRKYLT